MAIGTLALTGLASTQPIPGDFIEVRFAQGQSAGDSGAKKVLLIGPKLSTGTITADTEIGGPYGSADEISDVAGSGSIVHRMASKFFEIAGAGAGVFEVYILCPTEGAGTAATNDITYATTPTGAGVATCTVAGVTYAYSYTASDTVTTIAAGLVVAINNDPIVPVVASNVAGVLTLTAKIKGPEGNTIRAFGSTKAGTAVTASPTASTAPTNGATPQVYTTALATILGQKFHYIVPHAVDSTALAALKTQLNTQALPATGFQQVAINGQCATASAADTLAANSLNHERMHIYNLESSEVECYVVGAAIAACRVLQETSDPSFNFDGYGVKNGTSLPIPAPTLKADWFTSTECATMLNSGVSPIGVLDGKPFIVRSVTTRCKNGSNYDYRVRDTVRVCVADRLAADWNIRVSTAGYSKLTADPANQGPEPDASFATPRRVKAIAEQLVSDYCDAGYLDPAKKTTMVGSIACAIDTNNASAVNVRIPIFVANMLHQTRTLVAESSPAV